jgi:putative transposase
MAKPARNADPKQILSAQRTFFVSTKASMGRRVLQSEHVASLLIDVLWFYAAAKKFVVNDFVVMPDHLHALLTLDGSLSIEKAVQLIKGGFSYRVKKELGYAGEVWQHGFSEVRVRDRASFLAHREYIYENLVKAGLVDAPEKFRIARCFLRSARWQGLKPRRRLKARYGTTKVVPCYESRALIRGREMECDWAIPVLLNPPPPRGE